jgi:L-fucose isomerase-like protein
VSKRNLRPIKLGLVVGSREFFNGAPALETRKELIAHLDRLKIGYSILPLDATKNGAVQSREDGRRYARHFREQRESIDGLVICLPNFGDEIAISELINEARLDVPILLQASNDEIDKIDVHSRRDAFCGKFSITNNFHQFGVRFTDTTSHTSDIGGEEFAGDLDRFARTCRVVRGLRHARIGSIGARTGAFQTMRFSEKLLQASGLTVVTVDLSEIIFSANALSDDAPEVNAKLEEISAYGRIPAHIKREKIVRQAKWTIAVDRWIQENECDASAIQCWRSLQDNFGCATCVTMSMMGEKLMPSACEVDVMGALNVCACARRRGAVRNP